MINLTVTEKVTCPHCQKSFVYCLIGDYSGNEFLEKEFICDDCTSKFDKIFKNPSYGKTESNNLNAEHIDKSIGHSKTNSSLGIYENTGSSVGYSICHRFD